MTTKLTRFGIRVLIMAAAPYKLDTAHAEGDGVIRCLSPRGGTQQVAIVFRDTYGVREKYTLSVAGKPLDEFEDRLKMIISQESIVVRGRHLYTKLTSCVAAKRFDRSLDCVFWT